MIVIQRITMIWTKYERGTDRKRYQRPPLPDALPLPIVPTGDEVHIHDYSLSAFDDFQPREAFGTRSELLATKRYASDFPGPLRWRQTDIFEFGMDHPSPSRLRTHWPEVSWPLGILRPGDVQLIEWNGRFRYSLFGSNRSSYYQQQRIWLADSDAPDRDLFVNAVPRKHIDLRRDIY